MLYSCLNGTLKVAATKWAWAIVLIVGWVLWQVIGVPSDSAIIAILTSVVNPGVFTMSGWMISTLPRKIRSLYS